jgi:uncharacterized metal-binding protein YceD (DUF177 family)
MLLVDVPRIPPEGLDLDGALDVESAHLDGEEGFGLEPGGWLSAHVELADDRTVHVTGRLAAALRLECGRCLEPFALKVQQELDLFYLPHREDVAEEDEEEISDRDLVIAYYRGERIDLGETAREQLLLAVPMKRLCREECRGLCPSCGANRTHEPCNCREETEDLRLLPLKKLLGGGES